jgi:hypothetical protein
VRYLYVSGPRFERSFPRCALLGLSNILRYLASFQDFDELINFTVLKYAYGIDPNISKAQIVGYQGSSAEKLRHVFGWERLQPLVDVRSHEAFELVFQDVTECDVRVVDRTKSLRYDQPGQSQICASTNIDKPYR